MDCEGECVARNPSLQVRSEILWVSAKYLTRALRVGPKGLSRAHRALRGPISELYIKLYIILYRALWAHMGPYGPILGPLGPIGALIGPTGSRIGPKGPNYGPMGSHRAQNDEFLARLGFARSRRGFFFREKVAFGVFGNDFSDFGSEKRDFYGF